MEEGGREEGVELESDREDERGGASRREESRRK